VLAWAQRAFWEKGQKNIAGRNLGIAQGIRERGDREKEEAGLAAAEKRIRPGQQRSAAEPQVFVPGAGESLTSQQPMVAAAAGRRKLDQGDRCREPAVYTWLYLLCGVRDASGLLCTRGSGTSDFMPEACLVRWAEHGGVAVDDGPRHRREKSHAKIPTPEAADPVGDVDTQTDGGKGTGSPCGLCLKTPRDPTWMRSTVRLQVLCSLSS